jgi:hypothetical protein
MSVSYNIDYLGGATLRLDFSSQMVFKYNPLGLILYGFMILQVQSFFNLFTNKVWIIFAV